MKCCFEGGAVSGLGSRAASYTTNDKNVQELLENSKEFKSGMIKIAEEYGSSETKNESPEDEVRTLQQARQYLIERGVPVEEMQTKAKVIEAAAKLNITFQNL